VSILQSLVLGIVQGLTEFLPISSSGHLVLVPWLLGWELDPHAAFVFDVLVQWGTLLAVAVYFRKDLRLIFKAIKQSITTQTLNTDARLAWFVMLSTIPAVTVGLAIKPMIESVVDQPLSVSFFLFLTAGLLFVSERIGTRTKNLSGIRALDALFIGVVQILALFPGVSRSGATISGGLVRQLDREHAARFSFLMALPIMLAAGVVALYDLLSAENAVSQFGPLVTGTIAAAIIGYLSIDWLFTFISKRSLNLFGYYCVGLGLVGILTVVVRG
jgi:undecaprenyl-diphosphatase